MRKHIVILSIMTVVSVTMGETFQLKDTVSNEMYGSFQFKNGTIIKIGVTEWQLERVDPRRDEIIAEMKKTRIPSLDFRDADLNDVVLFISETVKRLGVKEMGLVLGQNADRSKNATISVRDCSVHDLLDQICKITGNQWSIRHGVVVFEGKQTNDENLSPLVVTATDGDASFYLKNVGTKKQYGPFQLKDEARVEAGSIALSIVLDTSHANMIITLKKIRIPQIDFRNASINEVVMFLNKTIQQQVPDVNIEVAVAKTIDVEKHTDGCSLRNTSVYDTIGILCDMAGLQWSIQNGVIVLENASR